MENLHEEFKKYLKEESESQNEFKIQALLVIAGKKDFLKTDILSNIRAIEGITRVHIDETVPRTYYEISKVTIKVNIAPFGIQPLEQIFNIIRRNIIAIPDVRRFTYISRPSQI